MQQLDYESRIKKLAELFYQATLDCEMGSKTPGRRNAAGYNLGDVMKAGFTGTQHGVTAVQIVALKKLFRQYKVTELHHGDCIGADAQAHRIVKVKGAEVVLHPPTDKRKRAFCEADVVHEPRPHIKRNHAIVDATEVVFACPSTEQEVLRSGTWATIRYAMKKSRPLYAITPSGKVIPFNLHTGKSPWQTH